MLKTFMWLAFLLGFVAGVGLNLLLTLLFWAAVGLAFVLLFDTVAGLGRRACAFRESVRSWLARRASPAPVYRKHIWVNI